MPRTRRATRRIRSIAAILLAIGITVVTTLGLAATAAAAPATPTCAGGSAPAAYGGQWYCPGYVIGVKRGAYGVGTRIVLKGVTVLAVSGTTATVEGGPSCLPPSTYCGAIVPSVAVTTTGLSTLPAVGDIVDMYGITRTATLTGKGWVWKGSSGCAPDFC